MHPVYRPDIDGLRAVAVVSVVLHHAFPDQFRTGYIGVDIFFVISGFLISSILFSGLRRGQFSLADFYRRRILRIFPALIAVLFTVYLTGGWVLFAGEFAQLGRHFMAGTAFVSNLLLWSEAGYFDQASYEKPLLHLWSLGIEEQFYIFWPGILWACWSRHVGFLAVTGGLLLCSFGWNIREMLLGHDAADFYSPLTRLWELMSGGLLAYLHQKEGCFPRMQAIQEKWSAVLSWAGVGLLITGLMVLKGHLYYPGYRALLPVMGTLLVIAAGSGAWANRWLLGNRFMVGVGLVSYPFYLWHWPLLTFPRILEGRLPDPLIRGEAVGLALVMAILTYFLIEKPVRFGRGRPVFVVSGLLGLMSMLAVAGAWAHYTHGMPDRAAAMADRRLPIDIPVSRVEPDQGPCHDVAEGEVRCRIFDPLPQHLVAGDSHAASLQGAIMANQAVFPALFLTASGCLPFLKNEVQLTIVPAGDERCHALARSILQALDHYPSLKTLTLVNRGPVYFTSMDMGANGLTEVPLAIYGQDKQRLKGSDAQEAWLDGYDDLLARLEARGVRVYLMIEWPELNFSPMACVPRRVTFSPRHDCNIARSQVESRQSDYRKLLDRLRILHPQLIVYDSTPLFCHAERCSALRDGHLLYMDDDHLSQVGGDIVFQDFLAKSQLVK